jgi:anti-sigma-K factor RskA
MKHVIFRYNHLLAAEFVLGTLQGLARRRYRYYLKQYPTLNQALDQWQGDLGSLADQLPEVKPNPELWRKIKNQL